MLRDDSGNGGSWRGLLCNVLGDRLEDCSIKPMAGFFRDGCCNTGPEDIGSHTVCAVMTAAFLEFSKSRGNDLSTPMPQDGFPGLTPGDRWCLCAPRWQEALEAGHAPRVVLWATHEGALDDPRSPISSVSPSTSPDVEGRNRSAAGVWNSLHLADLTTPRGCSPIDSSQTLSAISTNRSGGTFAPRRTMAPASPSTGVPHRLGRGSHSEGRRAARS